MTPSFTIQKNLDNIGNQDIQLPSTRIQCGLTQISMAESFNETSNKRL